MKKTIGWGVLILLAVLLVFYWQNRQNQGAGTGVTTKFIQADFIDLSKIYSISKFRSGSGHDFSGSGETCRSMKHYFVPQWSEDGQRQRDANNNLPPAPDGVNDVAIYSPVDGTITGIRQEQMPIGEQIYIRPDSNRAYTIRLFHIYKDAGIIKGMKVRAGQKIGQIGQYSSTDIAIQKGYNNFISYFDVMPDGLFAEYQARGVSSRSDLILTREYRDANPLQCNGESFSVNYDQDPTSGNFVFLSGYQGEKK